MPSASGSPLEQQGASRKGVGRWRHSQQDQASIGLQYGSIHSKHIVDRADHGHKSSAQP